MTLSREQKVEILFTKTLLKIVLELALSQYYISIKNSIIYTRQYFNVYCKQHI